MLTRPEASSRASGGAPAGPRVRRPLTLVALLGGLAAALTPLLVCLALGVVGWFVSDAGAHGAPRDGLRTGATAWLLAHGSGLRVAGAAVSVVPLGLSALCAWVSWRFGLRVGEAVSGRGPDADGIADGERDWTVPLATGMFGLAYSGAVIGTAYAAGVLGAPGPGVPGASGSAVRLVGWSLALVVLVVLPAVAVGSGRAAIWTALLPAAVRGALSVAARVVLTQLAVSAAVLAVVLTLDLASGATMLSELRLEAGEAALLTLVTATLLPNAVVFSGAYLLGPGFAVGTGTLVSPTLVSLGPVPAFPVLTALPDNGPTAPWTVSLLALPVVVAVLASAHPGRVAPAPRRWDLGALRGCVGGVLAGIAFGALAWVSGGSAGPGRMREVSPYAFDVLVHAIATFGIGGLVGGLLLTWRVRRLARPLAADAPDGAGDATS